MANRISGGQMSRGANHYKLYVESFDQHIARARDKAIWRGLSAQEADLLTGLPPKRGTPAWDEREYLRKRLGHGCISLGPL